MAVADSRVPELGAPHAFTDRQGGVSTGARASRNLALRAGESPESLVENWRRTLQPLGATPERLVLIDQVHGPLVHLAVEPTGPLQTAAAADALVTTVPDLWLAVRTADCVPVLFAADGVVGAAHAGWRGVASGVVGATVRAMVEQGARLDGLVAAVGPHISAGAYEVGEEVVQGIVVAGVPEDVFVDRSRPRPHVDLRAAVAWQLQQAGVQAVGHVRRCTFADADLYSHRRDGVETGRQAAVIGWVR
jgi:YfiH family protein